MAVLYHCVLWLIHRYIVEDDLVDGYAYVVGICTAALPGPEATGQFKTAGAVKVHKQPVDSESGHPRTLVVGSFEQAEIMSGCTFHKRLFYLHYSAPLLRWRTIVMSVSVCLSVCEHISGTTSPTFTKFLVRVICGPGSVIFWRRCDKLCMSGGIDNVIFARMPIVGTWSARSPVCPLILAYGNSILLPLAKTVCVSVRKNSVDVSTDKKWPLPR